MTFALKIKTMREEVNNLEQLIENESAGVYRMKNCLVKVEELQM
jgi:hypothetical protein